MNWNKEEALDPSILFGIKSLVNDETPIDIDELEMRVDNRNKPQDTFSEFDKLEKFQSKSIFENMYPSKNILDNKSVADYNDDINLDDSDDDEGDRAHTSEEVKHATIRKVMKDMKDIKHIDLQHVHDEDEKLRLLEEIDMLVSILQENEIDISTVTLPDNSWSLEDIMKVRQRLRLKNDRNRCRTFAEEIFLAAAHGLEYVFDGEKTYFGRRPDLSGWSDTVNVKLRHMRYDTSSFVNDVMKQHSFGPASRIMLELIPSMILYSRAKKKNYGDNLYSSEQMNNAIDRLRDIHETTRK